MTWTISHNGVEKSLADWELSDLTRSRQNLGVDTVQFFANGRLVDADDLFPYGETIIIQRDRIASSGANPTYSGGHRWFYGRIEPWGRSGDGRGESQRGSCVGPMWYLMNRVFRQSVESWASWTTPGDPTTPPVFETKTFNHIFLNQKQDGTKQTWRDQVIEALQWAITCGDPLQIGTVSPNFDVPVDEVKNITCAEVLQKMYRWCLDATFWWDYTTLPYPTLHCKRLSELVSVGIDLSAGNLIERIEVKERQDWRRPYVFLQFEQEVNGILRIVEDKWPDPIPAGPPPGGLETSIDLKGWSFNVVSQSIRTAFFDITDINWWAQKLPELDASALGSKVAAVTIRSGQAINAAERPKIFGRDGSAWDTNLTREILPGGGAIAEWMDYGAQSVRATAFADVRYKNGDVKQMPIHYDFTATDAPTGTYRTKQVTQEGDPVPVGLAKEMWTSLQALSAQGSITLTAEEVPELLDFGNTLNFNTTKRPAWANLNALIQQIEESAVEGRCTVTFGAPEHLSAGELVDLLRVARARFNPSPLSLRSGNTGGIGSTALPDQGGDGNSTSGAGQYQTHVVSGEPDDDGQFGVIKSDSGELSLSLYKTDEAGVAPKVSVKIAPADVPAPATDKPAREIKLREIQYLGSDCETMKRRWVLCTEEEDVS